MFALYCVPTRPAFFPRPHSLDVFCVLVFDNEVYKLAPRRRGRVVWLRALTLRSVGGALARPLTTALCASFALRCRLFQILDLAPSPFPVCFCGLEKVSICGDCKDVWIRIQSVFIGRIMSIDDRVLSSGQEQSASMHLLDSHSNLRIRVSGRFDIVIRPLRRG